MRSLELVEAASASPLDLSLEEPCNQPSTSSRREGGTRESTAAHASVSGRSSGDIDKGSGKRSGGASFEFELSSRGFKLRSLEDLGKAALSKLCMLLCQEVSVCSNAVGSQKVGSKILLMLRKLWKQL